MWQFRMISGVCLGHPPEQSNQLQQAVDVLRPREVRNGRGGAGHLACEVSCGSRTAVARRWMAQPVYPPLRKWTGGVPALTLRANSGNTPCGPPLTFRAKSSHELSENGSCLCSPRIDMR